MVSIKHKVTIKTKTAQEETPAAVETPVVTLKRKQPEAAPAEEKTGVTLKIKQPEVAPDPINPVEPKKSNTGKIVGGIAAAVAIFVGIYFFVIKGNDNAVNNGGAPTEQIAKAGETAQSEASQHAVVSEETTTGEGATANNDTKTAELAKAKETPESGNNSNATTPAKANKKQSEEPSTNEVPAAKSVKPSQPVQPKLNNPSFTNVVSASAPIGGDVVENAIRVIRGDFGNGKERKDKLGSAYSEIQSKVNELYRQGLVR